MKCLQKTVLLPGPSGRAPITFIHLFVLFFAVPVLSQESMPVSYNKYAAQKADPDDKLAGEIGYYLSQYDIFTINTSEIYRQLDKSKNSHEFAIDFGNRFTWYFNIEENEIRSAGYVLTTEKNGGIITYPRSNTVTYKGYVNGNMKNQVRMTITEDFLSASVEIDDYRYNLIPVNDLLEKPLVEVSNQYLFFEDASYIQNAFKCGTEIKPPGNQVSHNMNVGYSPLPLCLEAEIALVAATEMTQKKGGVQQVEAFMLSYLNSAQGFYDVIGINHVVTGAHVPQPSDPWTINSSLLNQFINWGAAGNLNHIQHDMAVLFIPDRIGNVLGVAAYQSVCNNSRKYMWTCEAGGYGTLAHEMGHAWGSPHDNDPQWGTPNSCPENDCVMRASASSVPMRRWSAATRKMIEDYASGVNCLVYCGEQKPEPAFYANTTLGCGTLSVQFTDESRFNPTSWYWDFGDGNTSTERNPVHIYSAPGKYTVTLKVGNENGENQIEKTDMITVETGQEYQIQKVGEQDKDIGTGGYAGGGRFMLFDALDDINLKSIKVYPESSGEIHLALTKNQGDTTIYGTTAFEVTAPEDRVALNWDLPAGVDYELSLMPSTPVNLYRNQSGATYPHNIDKLISIHSNYWAEQGNPKEGWYVGYDWEIRKTGCQVGTGIIDHAKRYLNIYPNPVSDILNIELTGDHLRKTEVKLYNLIGGVVYEKNVDNVNGTIRCQLDMSDLISGNYLLYIKSGDKIYNQKIIKE